MQFPDISLVLIFIAIKTNAQDPPAIPGNEQLLTTTTTTNNGRQPAQLSSNSGLGGGGGGGGGIGGGGPQIPFQFGTPAQALPQAEYITGQHDCGGQKYDRGMQCNDQGNTGPENAVFVIAPGGSLSNCVIGPNQVEGIHCEGECLLQNVWFEDVCEDAITFRQQQGTSYVVGGGAFNAVDKIMNHNGGGTVVVENFYCEQFGKIVRSCSDCENMSPRFIILQNVWAVGGLELVGLNAGSGDQVQIIGSCAQGVDRICSSYQGGGGGGGLGSGGMGGGGVGGGVQEGPGGGSGTQFPGTGIDGDGLSVGDPAIQGSGPSQQCQYTQADVQNCPPF